MAIVREAVLIQDHWQWGHRAATLVVLKVFLVHMKGEGVLSLSKSTGATVSLLTIGVWRRLVLWPVCFISQFEWRTIRRRLISGCFLFSQWRRHHIDLTFSFIVISWDIIQQKHLLCGRLAHILKRQVALSCAQFIQDELVSTIDSFNRFFTIASVEWHCLVVGKVGRGWTLKTLGF